MCGTEQSKICGFEEPLPQSNENTQTNFRPFQPQGKEKTEWIQNNNQPRIYPQKFQKPTREPSPKKPQNPVDDKFEQWKRASQFNPDTYNRLTTSRMVFDSDLNDFEKDPQKRDQNYKPDCSVIQESNRFGRKNDHAPSVFKAVVPDKNFPVREGKSNNTVSTSVGVDFDPFHQDVDIFRNSNSLAKLDGVFAKRLFERDQKRSMVFNMNSLHIGRAQYSSHGVIFDSGVDPEYREPGVVFKDDEFPANQTSLTGFGIDRKTKLPKDPSA